MSLQDIYSNILTKINHDNSTHQALFGTDILNEGSRNFPISYFENLNCFPQRRINRYVSEHPVWSLMPIRLTGSLSASGVRANFFPESNLVSTRNLNAFTRTLMRTEILKLDTLYTQLLRPSVLVLSRIKIREECLPAIHRYLRKHSAALSAGFVACTLQDEYLTITLSNTNPASFEGDPSASPDHLTIFKVWADNPHAVNRLFQPLIRCLDGLPAHSF